MRSLVLLGLTCAIATTTAISQVTVAQLQQFLSSREAAKESDAEIAQKLSSVALIDQLTAATLARIRARSSIGPETMLQLRLLAASSTFNAPPASELPVAPVPDQNEQQHIIQSTLNYVNSALHRLPDFVATRTTESFDNSPREFDAKASQSITPIHFVSEHRREIAYLNGHETDAPSSQSSQPRSQENDLPGLTTWGEFGPILTLIVGDSFKGSITWSRWQTSESGIRVAVFHYSVPKSASTYLIDLCCTQMPGSRPQPQFRDKPAYHGEIYIDPATGSIDRVTLEAELAPGSPITYSGIAVQYGRVAIGGVDYICPVRSVAVSELPDPDDEPASSRPPSKFINEVHFLNYHKFGSSARIVPSNPPPN